MQTTTLSKFNMGAIVSTRIVHQQLNTNSHFNAYIQHAIFQHSQLKGGSTCAADQQRNKAAIKDGDRIFSVFTIPEDLKNSLTVNENAIWIITEADRKSTCVLFPSDY